MSFHSWLQTLRSALATGRGRRHDRRRGSFRAATRRPNLEVLEDRSLLSFSPATSFPVGANPQAVATADFNNDGRLDLATADSGDNAVSVLLGNSQGGFGAASHFAAGSAPRSLVVSDFNNDGKIDLATGNADGVSVLPGNGDGTFRPPVHTDFWWGALSLAPADFNADGKMDLAYTSVDPTEWDTGFVQVLLGDGLGGFALGDVEYVYSSSTVGVAVADLNADGKVDVVTANEDTDAVSVLIGNGDGTLSYDYDFATGPSPQGVAVGDLTGDGIPDLVVAGQIVDVLPGLGDGTFASPIPHSANGSAHTAVATGDFNGDGKLDAVTSDGDAGTVSLMLGNGDGTLSYAGAFATGSSPAAIAVGAFNGDGRPDVATANAGSNSVSVLLNDGTWTPPPPPPPPAPRLRIADPPAVTEGNTGTRTATFTVTLSTASSQPVTVAYATGNGTATAGSDYQAASGTLTFAPGETTKTITVPVLGDRVGEPNEAFVVTLSSPTNAIIIDGQGVGTILDDEPRVSISDVTKAEGKNGKTALFTFTVTLSAAYDQAVTTSFRTVNGTATTSNGDYVARTGTLTFAPGETTKTVTIEVKGDNKRESNETFYLDLFGLSSNALFTKSRGLGTILNDD
ncbi:MAG TPA: FG-GAP-like repeat-containing protein [Gemmataceae bacterium]